MYSVPSILPKQKTQEKYTYKGEKGTLIIFPSSLKHCVGPYFGDEPRITLSFNSWFKGDLGDPKKSTYIPEKF